MNPEIRQKIKGIIDKLWAGGILASLSILIISEVCDLLFETEILGGHELVKRSKGTWSPSLSPRTWYAGCWPHLRKNDQSYTPGYPISPQKI